MRIQVYIISVLASLIAWGLIYDSSRQVYRDAWRAGVIPNLQLRHRIHHLLNFDRTNASAEAQLRLELTKSG